MSFAIEIKNLSFSYEQDGEFIKDLSLSIEKGKYTVILGHNGSGKSTLAKLIMGLLEKDAGEIYVLGEKLDVDTVYNIRNKVGIVFQNPDNQFIGSTVRDDIAFGLENHQVESSKMDDLILEYAKKVGMEEFLDKEPSNLSGGQKQRVAIAGILVMHPEIIIFDEATSMLDPKGKREIKELIAKMKEINPDITIISITHDIEEALLADNVVILKNGSVVLQDDSKNAFKDEKTILELNLDLPFNYKLYNLLKNKGMELDGNSMEEMVNSLCS